MYKTSEIKDNNKYIVYFQRLIVKRMSRIHTKTKNTYT